MKKSFICLQLIIMSFVLISFSAQAGWKKNSVNAGQQRRAEKALNDNQIFLKYIDSTISNLGTNKEKKIYRQCVQHNFLATFLYVRFKYQESYEESRLVQKKLLAIYDLLFEQENQTINELLAATASRFYILENPNIQHYLELGYTSLNKANLEKAKADSLHRRLYSQKLYQQQKALKFIKNAKTYPLYAIICSSLPLYAQDHLAKMSKAEKIKILKEKTPVEKREEILLQYDDCYFEYHHPSLYQKYLSDPQLKEIPGYQKYLELD